MDNKLVKLLENQVENHILPFFWQHGEDEATLREYMKVIAEANIGAVCVESRPHPDYVGPKWWADMDVILDEAQKRSMKVWILDDSHFPTGYANGAMHQQPKELARKSICCQKYEVKGGEQFCLSAEEVKHPVERTLSMIEGFIGSPMIREVKQKDFEDDEVIGMIAVNEEGRIIHLLPFIGEEGICWQAPEGSWVVYKLNVTRNRGPHPDYINMTDRESVRVLIDTVYEPHWDHYKDLFGTVIEGFFSDEPELGNGHLYDMRHFMGMGFEMDYPWSRELSAGLREAFGSDFTYKMAMLWETEGDEEFRAKCRYTYMDTLTRLVEECFSFQLGDWCREHGVKYIGHMIEDNGQHARTGTTLGHFFRGLNGEDWAGIDDIGGQVFPQGERVDIGGPDDTFGVRRGRFYHYMLGTLANSHAAIDALKNGNSMCEIFGAYGWSEGVQLEKYLIDHFMTKGVNHYVPHAFSAKEFPDPDCPPHFYAHGHNPQYRHFGALMKYINRVCNLISDGVHVSTAAILYHAEAEWTGKCMADELLGEQLCDAQFNYDFIPQDVFAESARYGTRMENGVLTVNTQSYEALFVPEAQFVTAEFAKALAKMKAAGIPVIFVGGRPEGLADTCENEAELLDGMKDCEVIALEELAAKARSLGLADLMLSPADAYIRFYHYIHKDGMEIYLLNNEGTETYKGSISIKGRSLEAGRCFIYDAWDNSLHAAKLENGAVLAEILPRKMQILVLPAEEDLADALQAAVTGELIPCGTPVALGEKWIRSTVESIAYPAFGEGKEVLLPDNLAEEQPLFSGLVRYENSFVAEAGRQTLLEITDAYEGVEVFVNGRAFPIQIIAPFLFDISEAVVTGRNEIVIEVATTLERAMSTQPGSFGRTPATPTCPSGINGLVRVYQN